MPQPINLRYVSYVGGLLPTTQWNTFYIICWQSETGLWTSLLHTNWNNVHTQCLYSKHRAGSLQYHPEESKEVMQSGPVCTNTLIDFVPGLLPYITHVINESLSSWIVPVCLKKALVTPLLKDLLGSRHSSEISVSIKPSIPVENRAGSGCARLHKHLERTICLFLVGLHT